MEAEFRSIIDSISDPFYVLDGAWRLVSVNAAVEAYWGCKREALLGRVIWEAFPQIIGTEPYLALLRAAAEGKPQFIEAVSSISGKWIAMSTYPREGGVTCHFRDIDGNKRLEAALQKSEAFLRLTQEAGRIGSWEWDSEGNIATASTSLFGLCGREPTADGILPAEEWLNWLHPDDRDRVMAEIRAALDDVTRDYYENEFRIIRPDGEERWHTGRGRIIRDPGTGKALRLLGIDIDVTDRRRAEEAVRELNRVLEARIEERTRALAAETAERRRAEEALAHAQRLEAIGRLTGSIAHDFSNMLTVIGGNLDILHRRLLDNPELRRLTCTAQAAVERATKLTRQLLSFSRRQRLKPEPVDANMAVSGMADLLHRTAGDHVRIAFRLAPGLWRVMADVHHLETALLNLVANARDAMKGEGTLTITTANTEFDKPRGEAAPGRYVCISVADTGCGIPPELQDRIFEPFFTTKEQGHGTGLGLSMVHGFVYQSNGFIELESQAGQGSTFRLFLPYTDAIAEPAPAIQAAQPEGLGGHETILVVEDRTEVRDLVTSVLRESGYTVKEAKSGEDALRLLEREDEDGVDLIFTDIVMPGKSNGLTLCQVVSARWPTIPILLTTGYAEHLAADRLPFGVETLAKPYRLLDLGRKIRCMLDARICDCADM